MAAGGGVRPRQAVQTKRGEVVGTCQDSDSWCTRAYGTGRREGDR
jgi:hypothetical protein